jgi:GntR family transcriptional regulator
MRLWISKSGEVSPREQMVTQIMLAIVSAELKPDQKLPSTRELARRFRLHPNTVSAAYRELAARGWVENRKGSGVYVRALTTDALAEKSLELDRIISSFLTMARTQGYSLADIRARVIRWLAFQPPDHFLVIEPDEELRKILQFEIARATGFRTSGAGYDACADESLQTGAALVALYSRAEDVRAKLPADVSCLWLHTRSVSDALPMSALSSPENLITVASRWADFLRWSRAIFLAAGGDPLALNFCDARDDDWRGRLAGSALVITDGLTAQSLPDLPNVRTFHIVSDESLAELRAYVERFLPRNGGD